MAVFQPDGGFLLPELHRGARRAREGAGAAARTNERVLEWEATSGGFA
jgi:hypothetical protein